MQPLLAFVLPAAALQLIIPRGGPLTAARLNKSLHQQNQITHVS